ncbi:hypothetical protein NP233_g13029 [Leucocoprinus birnbaumii]|uniref:Uncharacterized protein n=1 Tax=Leucocoprinus birnbaumii TaxID=56174 RepID=A0AAD5YPF8_9AGAR|nr:hypothetical protein NP233_g13029 [Leucocoprinus birnbaumii]
MLPPLGHTAQFHDNLSDNRLFDEKAPLEDIATSAPADTSVDIATIHGQSDQLLDNDIPDGGLTAWTVVFGSACCMFSTFGLLNCFGVFQAYYQETLLNDRSPSSIAWIGSIQYSLVTLPGLIAGRLFDIGYFRPLFFSTSVLLVTATFLVGQCTQYWQFLLCQGFAVGFACCGVFTCSNAVIAHWFKSKRGRALGYMGIGCAISGSVFPVVCKRLIPLVGFPWTMRILGFMLLLAMGLSNLTVKRRLPPMNSKSKLLSFAVFKHVPFSVYSLAAVFITLGLYTFLNYIATSAILSGTSPEFAFYFVSLFNASTIVGRWSAGLLGDRVGPLNVLIPHLFVIGIVTCVWPALHSTGALMAIIIIYGISYGSYITLSVVPPMNMGGEADVGSRTSVNLAKGDQV